MGLTRCQPFPSMLQITATCIRWELSSRKSTRPRQSVFPAIFFKTTGGLNAPADIWLFNDNYLQNTYQIHLRIWFPFCVKWSLLYLFCIHMFVLGHQLIAIRKWSWLATRDEAYSWPMGFLFICPQRNRSSGWTPVYNLLSCLLSRSTKVGVTSRRWNRIPRYMSLNTNAPRNI